VPYPCPVPIAEHWHIADLDGGGAGWYVVSPSGKTWGPYTEDEAGRLLDKLRGQP